MTPIAEPPMAGSVVPCRKAQRCYRVATAWPEWAITGRLEQDGPSGRGCGSLYLHTMLSSQMEEKDGTHRARVYSG